MDVYRSSARAGHSKRAGTRLSAFSNAIAGGALMAPGAAGRAVSGSERTVEVNQLQCMQATEVARVNIITRSVVEKVLSDAVDCPFEIALKYGDDAIKLPQSEQHIIEQKWPSFMRDALWHLLVVGFVVVGRESARPGIPRVIPLAYLRVMFRESARAAREYWVEERATARRLDAVVFVKYPPDLAGNLTSAGVSVMEHALRYERVLANQDDSDYNRSHPVWAHEVAKDGAGRPDALEHDEFFLGEVQERYMRYHADVHAQERRDLADVQRTATEQYRRNIEQVSANGGVAPVPLGAAHVPPWSNVYFVPMNQHLIAGPTPEANPHFQTELESLESKILAAFHVPPLVMATSHAVRYASQPEIALRQWSFHVRSTQRELGTMLAEVYMFVNTDMFSAYADAVLGRTANMRADAMGEVERRTRGGGEAKRTRREGGADDEEAAADGEDLTRPGAPVKNDAGQLQIPETEETLARAARVLSVSDGEVMAHLRSQFRVSVTFNARPMLNASEVYTLYEQGVIARDTFATLAADLVGLSPDAVLVGAEAQEKDARERKRLQDILVPPEEKPIPDKKRKPAK